MAASHALAQNPGTPTRGATTLVDLDNSGVIATGSSIGATIGTTLQGNDVDTAAIIAYTSTSDLVPTDFIQAWINLVNTTLTAGNAAASENQRVKYPQEVTVDFHGNLYSIEVTPQVGLADAATIASPTITLA